MLVKQLQLSVSLYYTGKITKSVKLTKVRHKWTGWARAERGITITSAATTAQSNNHRVNIIDTGHDGLHYRSTTFSCIGRCGYRSWLTIRCEPQTETVWRQTTEYGVPRIVFANKWINRCWLPLLKHTSRSSSSKMLNSIAIGAEDDFLDHRLDQDEAEIYTNDLVQISWRRFQLNTLTKLKIPWKNDRSGCRNWMKNWWWNTWREEITNEELKLVSVSDINVEFFQYCGSASRTKGSLMLDGLSTTFQAHDIPAIKGINWIQMKKNVASDEEPFAALAFKIMIDPFVGRLTFFRVYSGVLELRFLRIEHF